MVGYHYLKMQAAATVEIARVVVDHSLNRLVTRNW